MLDIITIPCTMCSEETNHLGTKLCNNCWEVTTRLPDFLKSEKGRARVLECVGPQKPTPFTFDGQDWGVKEILGNRDFLIEIRDLALSQNEFGSAVSLSHSVMLLAKLVEAMGGEI